MLNKSRSLQGPKEAHPCENFIESHINKVFVNYLRVALGKAARGRRPQPVYQ